MSKLRCSGCSKKYKSDIYHDKSSFAKNSTANNKRGYDYYCKSHKNELNKKNNYKAKKKKKIFKTILPYGGWNVIKDKSKTIIGRITNKSCKLRHENMWINLSKCEIDNHGYIKNA